MFGPEILLGFVRTTGNFFVFDFWPPSTPLGANSLLLKGLFL